MAFARIVAYAITIFLSGIGLILLIKFCTDPFLNITQHFAEVLTYKYRNDSWRRFICPQTKIIWSRSDRSP